MGSTEKRGRGRPLIDDKRRIILDAALVVFAERGYHGTTVPEVAEEARVGMGTLYRYFEHKEALVNEVYRDAKQRLRSALLDDAPALDVYKLDVAERWFSELWRRLGDFAKAEPAAFRFLEMQDHVAYLDRESREVELSVLAPLWLAGKQLRDRSMLGGARGVGEMPGLRASKVRGARGGVARYRLAGEMRVRGARGGRGRGGGAARGRGAASGGGPSVDVLIALLWGAFVGLIKAQRLGYLKLDDSQLREAGAACWRMIAPPPLATGKKPARKER